MEALKADDPGVELRRTEFVGPQVGNELLTGGLKALGLRHSGHRHLSVGAL